MEGKHFQFKNDVFIIFGQWFSTIRVRKKVAYETPIDTNWVIASRECPPNPIFQEIEKRVKRRKGPIEAIEIDALTTGRLYLEGRLKQEMFFGAIEEEDCVIVPLEFAGESRKVVIRKNARKPFRVI